MIAEDLLELFVIVDEHKLLGKLPRFVADNLARMPTACQDSGQSEYCYACQENGTVGESYICTQHVRGTSTAAGVLWTAASTNVLSLPLILISRQSLVPVPLQRLASLMAL